MKTTKHLSILVLVFCLSFSTMTYAQTQTGDTITITLHVNTADIVKPNVNAFANFGQPVTVSNENFTVHARIGDVIRWKGVSSSAPLTDKVSVRQINHEGGVNVFGQNTINGNGEFPEEVFATVILGNPGDEDKYKLSFKVFNGDRQRNGTFHIDPKIIIKP